ncbi:hypothetical protein TUBRATIS_26870 [Tubulinosema ratisbonensis]|uniref:Uncharacterized protein n=1 Tax=Tubulinosema ratisbonensis TaxID=291195 RepID=A0A437AI46_9MICR|nr:hypothetical protein TUBRATIS_26870 [Tubulinosema ratisbonensis]
MQIAFSLTLLINHVQSKPDLVPWFLKPGVCPNQLPITHNQHLQYTEGAHCGDSTCVIHTVVENPFHIPDFVAQDDEKEDEDFQGASGEPGQTIQDSSEEESNAHGDKIEINESTDESEKMDKSKKRKHDSDDETDTEESSDDGPKNKKSKTVIQNTQNVEPPAKKKCLPSASQGSADAPFDLQPTKIITPQQMVEQQHLTANIPKIPVVTNQQFVLYPQSMQGLTNMSPQIIKLPMVGGQVYQISPGTALPINKGSLLKPILIPQNMISKTIPQPIPQQKQPEHNDVEPDSNVEIMPPQTPIMREKVVQKLNSMITSTTSATKACAPKLFQKITIEGVEYDIELRPSTKETVTGTAEQTLGNEKEKKSDVDVPNQSANKSKEESLVNQNNTSELPQGVFNQRQPQFLQPENNYFGQASQADLLRQQNIYGNQPDVYNQLLRRPFLNDSSQSFPSYNSVYGASQFNNRPIVPQPMYYDMQNRMNYGQQLGLQDDLMRSYYQNMPNNPFLQPSNSDYSKILQSQALQRHYNNPGLNYQPLGLDLSNSMLSRPNDQVPNFASSDTSAFRKLNYGNYPQTDFQSSGLNERFNLGRQPSDMFRNQQMDFNLPPQNITQPKPALWQPFASNFTPNSSEPKSPEIDVTEIENHSAARALPTPDSSCNVYGRSSSSTHSIPLTSTSFYESGMIPSTSGFPENSSQSAFNAKGLNVNREGFGTNSGNEEELNKTQERSA